MYKARVELGASTSIQVSKDGGKCEKVKSPGGEGGAILKGPL